MSQSTIIHGTWYDGTLYLIDIIVYSVYLDTIYFQLNDIYIKVLKRTERLPNWR